jgi:hypothetical protein
LRLKLAKEAKKQNPKDPGDSPIARDLRAGKKVKTVARDHGVLPKGKPEKPRRKFDGRRAYEEAMAQLRRAPNRERLGIAYSELNRLALAGHVGSAEADAAGEAYHARAAELDAAADRPSAVHPVATVVPTGGDVAAERDRAAVDRLRTELNQRVDDLLELARNPSVRAECEAAMRQLIATLQRELESSVENLPVERTA